MALTSWLLLLSLLVPPPLSPRSSSSSLSSFLLLSLLVPPSLLLVCVPLGRWLQELGKGGGDGVSAEVVEVMELVLRWR